MKADEKNYYIAVDLGATSGRVILASFDGEKVETEEIHRFKHPMLPIGGHIFWNLHLGMRRGLFPRRRDYRRSPLLLP